MTTDYIGQTLYYIEKTHPITAPYTLYVGMKENHAQTGKAAYRQKGTTKAELMSLFQEGVLPDCNIYLAPAEFDPQTKKRTKTAVQQINTLIIDLDYKNTDFKGMEAEQLMEYAWSRGFFEKIPCPSFCMESSAGLGLHLIWLLDKPFVVNGDYRNINRWERVLKAICKHFAPLGADNACCDIGHVFRVAGTTNTKTDATAKLLFWEELRNTEPVHYDFEAVEKPFLSS